MVHHVTFRAAHCRPLGDQASFDHIRSGLSTTEGHEKINIFVSRIQRLHSRTINVVNTLTAMQSKGRCGNVSVVCFSFHFFVVVVRATMEIESAREIDQHVSISKHSTCPSKQPSPFNHYCRYFHSFLQSPHKPTSISRKHQSWTPL